MKTFNRAFNTVTKSRSTNLTKPTPRSRRTQVKFRGSWAGEFQSASVRVSQERINGGACKWKV
jgi:hypothetical protein